MDVYTKYDVERVINASGKMTILGGSRVSETVTVALQEGAKNFFLISNLQTQLEGYLKSLLKVPGVRLVSSASSGIAQCVASTIAKDNIGMVVDLYNPKHTKREIVMPIGHVVNYGTPISLTIGLGGGTVVEAGYANECTASQVEAKITENTVALLYVKSHHCVQKSILEIEEMAAIAKKYNLPFIIDAAAEEDLRKYIELGADAVVYSGTKALAGPTAGLVIAKESFLQYLRLQAQGIGRIMKVGKESMLGLAQAIENYVGHQGLSIEKQLDRLAPFNEKLSNLAGVSAKAVQDDAGRAIIRSQIHFDNRYDAKAIAKALKEGSPMIYTRDYRLNLNIIEIDIRDVSETELEEIYQRIVAIIG